MIDAASDLNRFYSVLAPLEAAGKQGLRLSSYSGKSGFPTRGVYFFREPGEYRTSHPTVPRIVRVGTHAVSVNSKSTLWTRLRAHLGTREGGGHHRGSIFRLHVGAALLARDSQKVASWGEGSTAPAHVRSNPAALAAEADVERRVSEYLGAMSVLWVNVPDDAGPSSIRAYLERNAIGLLSNQLRPVEPASPNWLGSRSPRSEIRRSHLWNLNYVEDQYQRPFLDRLEEAVAKTLEG